MYVAAKADGLVIVDVTRPAAPVVWPGLTFGGALNDAEDVIVASTNASLFGYVADGRNGIKVLQLTSPDDPGLYGFSPKPTPELIAWAKRSEEHTSELQSLMRISHAVFCLKKKTHKHTSPRTTNRSNEPY